MKKTDAILSIFISFLFLAGCAEIQMPKPTEAVKQTVVSLERLEVGMRKEVVLEIWGEPDEKIVNHEQSLTSKKEKWIYKGRYTKMPVKAGYVSETRTLYFDNDVLVSWE